MDTIKLYFKFLAVHLKSAMAYKASFFFSSLGHLLIALNVYLGVIFLMNRFGSVKGYTLPELTLCFGVILMASSLAEVFGRGFDVFDRVLSQAHFDRMLVRPRGLMFQVLCHEIKPTVISRVIQAGIMLVLGIRSGAVEWTVGKGITLAVMVLWGSALFFGVFMINGALCFFTLEGLEVINIFTDGIREYGKYPFDIYGKSVLWVLTLLVPMALVQYWPLQYLLGRGPGWYGFAPLLSIPFLLGAARVWRFGVRHYQSTGS